MNAQTVFSISSMVDDMGLFEGNREGLFRWAALWGLITGKTTLMRFQNLENSPSWGLWRKNGFEAAASSLCLLCETSICSSSSN